MPDDVTPNPTGNDPDGAGSESPPKDSLFSQEQVKTIAAKEHRRGAQAALKTLLAKAQVESEEDLLLLVQGARAATPTTPTTTEDRKKAKEQSAVDQVRQEYEQKFAEQKQRADAAVIKAAVLEHLSDTNDPDVALFAIAKVTGARLAVQEDGRVLPVDKDGDPIAEDLGKWLAAEKAKVPWELKPNGGSNAVQVKRPKTREEAEAEARAERARAQDPNYRVNTLAGRMLEAGLIK